MGMARHVLTVYVGLLKKWDLWNKGVNDLAKTRAPWLTTALLTLYDSVLGGACMYGVMRLRYMYEGKFAAASY